MAETAATTRPARTRPARPATAKAPAKATGAKAPATAAKPQAEKVNVTRFTVELEHVGTTKQYEKFGFPADMKGVVVGNVYAPIGTQEVKVLIIGEGDAGTAE